VGTSHSHVIANGPTLSRSRRIVRRLAASTIALACAVGVMVQPDGRVAADSDRVAFEVLVPSPTSPQDVADRARRLGGAAVGDAPGLVLVEIPERTAARFADSMTELGATVRPPVAVDARPEQSPLPEQFGPTTGGADGITNALAWHAAGHTGKGVRVGVIDYFDVASYWNVAEHGPLPVAGVTAKCFDVGRDCTNDFFDGIDRGGEDHGVAVVEVIRDMAPDVEIYLGQATTTTDYQALVDWFASNGVMIINRSLGSRYDGPGDGRGPLGDVAASATARGITWVNSGGNNGVYRYYRQPVRLSGNRVAFGPDGTGTYLPMRGCVDLGGVRWADDWDLPPNERTDYDVFLWESPTDRPGTGAVVASSQLRQQAGAPPLELINDEYCPASGTTMYLEVRWLGGDTTNDTLEITDYGSGISSYTQAPSSGAVPIVDSDDPGVIAVGAIDPPDGDQIAGYSSQGPTNDGRIAPDVAAPARFASVASDGVFAGTSAAAAVVSGGAALLLDAGLAVAGDPLGDLLRNIATDIGAPGPDNVSGHGEFVLPDPPATTGVDATPSVFVPLPTPRRVLDTRPTSPVGPADLIGELWRGETLDLPVVSEAGLPSGAVTAVAVNIVSVGADRPSHVQAMPTLRATLGGYSNLNIDRAGQTRANFAIVPVGEDGSISINSIAEGHVVVDLLGWFRATPSATSAGRFAELPSAQRVVDSRSIAPVTPLRSGEVRAVPMPQLPPGVDPSMVDALVVSVTATQATADGWIQAIPAGRTDVTGTTSTLNIGPGDTVANAAIVPVGNAGTDSAGISLTSFFANSGSADVIVDVTGYITSTTAKADAAGRFVALRPDRAFDSRLIGGPLGDATTVPVDATTVGVPVTASGVVWNVTIAGATRAGHTTGWAVGTPKPATSLLNWSAPNTTRAASAVTAVGAGSANFQVEDGPVNSPSPLGDLIADVFGYFT
jgi:hypothetical protein